MQSPLSTRWDLVPCGVLALLLIAGLPLFVCMPVCGDVTLWSVAARTVLTGGIYYRDVFDTTPPGMLWLHMGIRTLCGPQLEFVRLADVAFLSAIVWLLVRWLRCLDVPRGQQRWAAVALFAFYLSTTEWCHCQKDTWMLLPALAALSLRRRQVMDLTQPAAPALRIAVRAVAEGVCWACAFWIKPHVAVPGLITWLAGTTLAARGSARFGRLATDGACLLAGGLTAGSLGSLWMLWSGTWPHFWDVALSWDPEYFGGSAASHSWSGPWCVVFLLTRFFPWGLLHLVAVPAGVAWLRRALARSAGPAASAEAPQSGALLAAFYLGWLWQAAFIQQDFDYAHAPIVLLATTLVAGRRWPIGQSAVGWLAVTTTAACVPLLLTPATLPLERLRQRDADLYRTVFDQPHPFNPRRIVCWGQCWRDGSTPELRDRLAALNNAHAMTWGDLGRVASYLRTQGVGDGELTCYHNSTHPLYLELNLKPATRFMHFGTIIDHFPSRLGLIAQELTDSRQRYVVSDLRAVGLSEVDAAIAPSGLPAAFPRSLPDSASVLFPWSHPVVFRSGRYVVHRLVPSNIRVLSSSDERKELNQIRRSFQPEAPAEVPSMARKGRGYAGSPRRI